MNRINVPQISENAYKHVEKIVPADQFAEIHKANQAQFGDKLLDSDIYTNSVMTDMMRRFQLYVITVVQQTADELQKQFTEALENQKL
jgi:hypothetical protein